MRQSSTLTVQSGCEHVACIASMAVRWAAVASRLARPSSSTTPAPFSTTGRMSASQASRRMVSTGIATPLSVSHNVIGLDSGRLVAAGPAREVLPKLFPRRGPQPVQRQQA